MHSSRAVLKEKRRAGKASGSLEKPEEPVKRKHKSKHCSKKAAKKATRSRRSHEPPDEELTLIWEMKYLMIS